MAPVPLRSEHSDSDLVAPDGRVPQGDRKSFGLGGECAKPLGGRDPRYPAQELASHPALDLLRSARRNDKSCRRARLLTVEIPAPIDPGEAARERALREVGETMLMIESVIARVDRALATIQEESAPDRQALAGLLRAKRDMEGVRRRLHQDVYLYVDALPFD